MNAATLKMIRDMEGDQFSYVQGKKPEGSANIRTVVGLSAAMVRELDLSFKIPARAILSGKLSIVSLWKPEPKEWIDSWLVWRLHSPKPVVLGRVPLE